MPRSLLDLCRSPGVNDLPKLAQVKFARALIAEEEGKTEDAERLLAEAIAAAGVMPPR